MTQWKTTLMPEIGLGNMCILNVRKQLNTPSHSVQNLIMVQEPSRRHQRELKPEQKHFILPCFPQDDIVNSSLHSLVSPSSPLTPSTLQSEQYAISTQIVTHDSKTRPWDYKQGGNPLYMTTQKE
jgi:hypothetical protein